MADVSHPHHCMVGESQPRLKLVVLVLDSTEPFEVPPIARTTSERTRRQLLDALQSPRVPLQLLVGIGSDLEDLRRRALDDGTLRNPEHRLSSFSTALSPQK